MQYKYDDNELRGYSEVRGKERRGVTRRGRTIGFLADGLEVWIQQGLKIALGRALSHIVNPAKAGRLARLNLSISEDVVGIVDTVRHDFLVKLLTASTRIME